MSDELDPDLVIEVAEDYALSLPEAAEMVRATLETQEAPPFSGGDESRSIASATDLGAHGR